MDCVDTHILIWECGGYDRVTRGQEDMVARTQEYFKRAKLNKLDIMIPTPVLAEYWVGAPSQERRDKRVYEIAAEIAPFDARAAALAADLFRDQYKMEELSKKYNIGYDCIKIDMMIAAIAITNERATRLVTHDSDLFVEIVKDRIEVRNLSDFGQDGRQKIMFRDWK